jgi:hypothetical protein
MNGSAYTQKWSAGKTGRRLYCDGRCGQGPPGALCCLWGPLGGLVEEVGHRWRKTSPSRNWRKPSLGSRQHSLHMSGSVSGSFVTRDVPRRPIHAQASAQFDPHCRTLSSCRPHTSARPPEHGYGGGNS